MRLHGHIPGWMVLGTITFTAIATFWAMVASGRAGGWGSDPSQTYPPREVTGALSPGATALSDTATPAAQASAPTLVGNQQAPMLFVAPPVEMPHGYAGICSRCHRMAVGTWSQPGSATTAEPPTARPTALQTVAGTTGGTNRTTRANTTTTAAAPTEASWLGMEVSLITNRSVARYHLAAGTTGVVVAEAEAQAGVAGVLAGDLVVTVNRIPVGNLTEFVIITDNGALSGGTVEVLRSGKRLGFELGQTRSQTNSATAVGAYATPSAYSSGPTNRPSALRYP